MLTSCKTGNNFPVFFIYKRFRSFYIIIKQASYEKTIEDMKNESLDSMVKRIAAETVEKSIRENLTLEIHAWGGADVNGHLEWNGKEF